MSSGGSIAAMITSLKNNKRPRKSALKKYKNYTFERKGKLHFDKKASQKQLILIRERIRLENRRRMRMYIILFISFFIVLISIIGFVKF